jgi:SAM-dependent methyltransferase
VTTPVVDGPLIDRLRADLTAAAFTVEGIPARIGPVAAAALDREQDLPALLATEDATDPCGVLVRLFTLGRPVPEESLDRALPTLGTAGAVALGLVTVEGGTTRPTCDLSPYADEAHDWWVASDLSELATRGPLRPDHVLGVGGASMTLAFWTIRRPAARALDLGTGCGVQALHLTSHVDHVVATDVSERALAYAAFNAALAGIDLEVLAGDLLEPVAGRRFDLVVSNPPFVITPRRDDVPLYEYRDGGRPGDTLVRSLVRQVGDVLEPGGVAQFLGNWEIRRGQSWRDVWAEWLDGIQLDAWVVQREVQDPAEYAELWARDGGTQPGSEAYDRLYAAWLADFAARDVESIGFGIVALQRPITDREPWRDLAEAGGPVASPMGPPVDAGLRARTWLAEHTDDEVLDIAWSCAGDVTVEQHSRPGADDPSVILVRQGGGLGRAVRADTLLAAYVGVADGELTARAALDAIATVLEVDPEAVRRDVLPTLRGLVADGLLV